MRKWAVWIIAAALLLAGCSSNEQPGKAVAGEQSQVQIGICFDTFVVERWIKDRDVFTYTATELGASVDVQNANGDVEKQREQIRHLIDEKVDALVIIAIDGEKIKDLLEEAHQEGIKIVAYDRLIVDAPVDLYISFDNCAVGELMAEAIADQGGEEKKVLMICGPDSDKNVKMVSDGFHKVAKKNKMEIIDEANIEGWRAENVDIYLDGNPGLLQEADAIMCGNDNLAGEVVQILSENRLAGQVMVTGQDADLEACQRIVEGTQQMTVYKSVELLARQAAELTMELIDQKDIKTDTINNGLADIPYVALKPEAVDAGNMDDIVIHSGFHLEEDVYMNVSGETQ